MATKSLKKIVIEFGKEKFFTVFPSTTKHYIDIFRKKISSRNGGLFVIAFNLLFFAFGQFLQPKFLQIIPLPIDVAKSILDQRITNLATIFSITLVVIGWLITNISIKESISFQLLFKKTYIYPIFYFIISLIGLLMIASLLRDAKGIDLSEIVISGTYLILIALISITFLFFRLITVVRTNFFYSSLEKDVMEEVFVFAKKEIIQRKSRRIYKEYCEQLGFVDGIKFGTDLSKHNGINITPLAIINSYDEMTIEKLFSSKKTFIIEDINLTSLNSKLKTIKLIGVNYYKLINLGYTINENYNSFYFDSQCGDISKIKDKVKKTFKLKPRKKIEIDARPNLDYLCQRFEKDIEDGKRENVEMALEIFSKIFLLENQIIKEC